VTGSFLWAEQRTRIRAAMLRHDRAG